MAVPPAHNDSIILKIHSVHFEKFLAKNQSHLSILAGWNAMTIRHEKFSLIVISGRDAGGGARAWDVRG
jgi:hypothetical protein